MLQKIYGGFMHINKVCRTCLHSREWSRDVEKIVHDCKGREK